MLETVRGLGYAGDRARPSRLPVDARRRSSAHGLELVGGFAPLRFDGRGRLTPRTSPSWLDPIADCCSTTGARGPVVLAGDENESGSRAGRPDRRAVLAETRRTRAERVERLPSAPRRRRASSTITRRRTSRRPRRSRRCSSTTDVGICFDTGHALVGGGDPVERRAAVRRPHRAPASEGRRSRRCSRACVRGELTLEQAWARRHLLPVRRGRGRLRCGPALPELAGFDGWTVLEQDRVAVRVERPAGRARGRGAQPRRRARTRSP